MDLVSVWLTLMGVPRVATNGGFGEVGCEGAGPVVALLVASRRTAVGRVRSVMSGWFQVPQRLIYGVEPGVASASRVLSPTLWRIFATPTDALRRATYQTRRKSPG